METYTTSIAFTAFSIFCDNMGSVKYIYPCYLHAVYMKLTHMTVDGQPFVYDDSILDSFKKAVIYIFFEDDEEYDESNLKPWLEKLPVDYKDEMWRNPTTNHIIHNKLYLKLDL